ncbi:Gfo/Idh/MocA family oxidoreductase, partial [Mycobacterium tuberculosis]|nr:Gfo/Idh/MocA family oxidoreductase [Mycobacterium tuberculosis]
MKKAEKMAPRIAVLGCGYWGSNHIRTLKSLGALFAVSDQNTDRAAGFAAEQNVLHIEVDDRFTHPEVGAIVMALPPQLHAAAALRAVT